MKTAFAWMWSSGALQRRRRRCFRSISFGGSFDSWTHLYRRWNTCTRWCCRLPIYARVYSRFSCISLLSLRRHRNWKTVCLSIFQAGAILIPHVHAVTALFRKTMITTEQSRMVKYNETRCLKLAWAFVLFIWTAILKWLGSDKKCLKVGVKLVERLPCEQHSILHIFQSARPLVNHFLLKSVFNNCNLLTSVWH